MNCELCGATATGSITVNTGDLVTRTAVCLDCALNVRLFLGRSEPERDAAIDRYADDHAGDSATNPTN